VQADRNAPVYGTGEIEIAVDPETVWKVLADIQSWPSWNPDITQATLAGPVRPGTTFTWKSGPGTITSTFQVVDEPTELTWTGRTMGIPAVHVYRLGLSEQPPGHTVVSTEESWGELLARLLRKRFTTTLKTAIDSGLTRLKAEAERRVSP
jgi:uncharacterized protein YndB with AHSA1/START domain